MFLTFSRVSVPEALDFVVNKYAEHTHEKWSLEKVTQFITKTIKYCFDIIKQTNSWR